MTSSHASSTAEFIGSSSNEKGPEVRTTNMNLVSELIPLSSGRDFDIDNKQEQRFTCQKGNILNKTLTPMAHPVKVEMLGLGKARDQSGCRVARVG